MIELTLIYGAFLLCKKKKGEKTYFEKWICTKCASVDRTFDAPEFPRRFCSICGVPMDASFKTKEAWIFLQDPQPIRDYLDKDIIRQLRNETNPDNVEEDIYLSNLNDGTHVGLDPRCERYKLFEEPNVFKSIFLGLFNEQIEMLKQYYVSVELKVGLLMEWD
jgi:hypothetical protein